MSGKLSSSSCGTVPLYSGKSSESNPAKISDAKDGQLIASKRDLLKVTL